MRSVRYLLLLSVMQALSVGDSPPETSGLTIVAPQYCDLPSRITRRTVAIWSPHATGSVSTAASCPKDYPYAMYNGAWCCHVNGKVDYKKEYENTAYYYCDGYSCCKRYAGSLRRCPHGRCRNSPDYWQLPNNYDAYYGDTKNVGSTSSGQYFYNNVNDINRINEDDYVVVQCDNNEYKAFVCDEPGATWYKDCKDPTDGLQVEALNYLVPHHLRLEAARLNCRNSGGHLATIRSDMENTLAAKVMLMRGQGNECAFIGFTDERSSGVWRWMNGSPVTYTNWAYHRIDRGWDQPNDGFGHGQEDYTAMCRYQQRQYNPGNDFKWFDVGPPRNYFGNTVNFELAFSFCTDSANFVASSKNCRRPLRPCGGNYVNKKKVIEHGKSTYIRCKRGFHMAGNPQVTCYNGVASTVPRCLKIEYGGYSGDGAEPTSVPRVGILPDNNTEPDDMRAGRKCVGGDDVANTGYSVGQGDEGYSVGAYGEDSIPRKG